MSSKYNHITPILKELHWLPIPARIHYKVILLTFKAIHGLAPTYLSELISQYLPTRSLRSASQNLLVVHRSRTKSFGDRSFECAVPTLWNSLPGTLRAQSNIDIFQKELKTYFVQHFLSILHWFVLSLWLTFPMNLQWISQQAGCLFIYSYLYCCIGPSLPL